MSAERAFKVAHWFLSLGSTACRASEALHAVHSLLFFAMCYYSFDVDLRRRPCICAWLHLRAIWPKMASNPALACLDMTSRDALPGGRSPAGGFGGKLEAVAGRHVQRGSYGCPARVLDMADGSGRPERELRELDQLPRASMGQV